MSAHLHNICMDFPQFHSDEDVYGKRYSEKTSYSKRHNYFLQQFVPYTLFYNTPFISMLKFVETGIFFFK